ncbi:MAG: hypothetical protein ACSHXW_15810 [Yoonia sp.]
MTNSSFDPAIQSKTFRDTGFSPITEADLQRFGPTGLWRAGAQQLRSVLRGWWLAEVTGTEQALAQAVRWLAAPAKQGRPWGDPWEMFDAEHALARALTAEMTGKAIADHWEAAHQAYQLACAEVDAFGRTMLAPAAAICAAMAGKPVKTDMMTDPDMTAHGVAILTCLEAGDEPAALARALSAEGATLLRAAPELEVAALFNWVWRNEANVRLNDALQSAYVLAPSVSLPARLREEGWDDGTECTLRCDPSHFAGLARMLPLLGMVRDLHGTTQEALPAQASWTRQPDLSLEADWSQDQPDRAVFEIRGKGAVRLGAWLSGQLGARRLPGKDDALTDLLSVPLGTVPLNATTAALRWMALCEVAKGEWPDDADLPARALVRAGLRDTDWRVRMTAVWIVGHHKLAGLARETEAARLPEIGNTELRQQDRRTLLAMRALAAARSAGQRLAAKAASDPAFLNRLSDLLDTPPNAGGDDAAALLTALLQRDLAASERELPRQWRNWIER